LIPVQPLLVPLPPTDIIAETIAAIKSLPVAATAAAVLPATAGLIHSTTPVATSTSSAPMLLSSLVLIHVRWYHYHQLQLLVV
jgi:hypothetical protein